MANFFDDKNYTDYFEKLNNRLNSSQENVVKKRVPNSDSPKETKKKGFYKTFRLKRIGLLFPAVLMLCLTLVIIFSVRSCSVDKTSNNGTVSVSSLGQTSESVTSDDQIKNTPQKIIYSSNEDVPDFPESNDAKAGIIIKKSNNTIVAAREPHKKIYPASTIKIMTLLCAVENIEDVNDTFTMTYEITDPLYVSDASVAGFLNNEKVTMTDLLYGMILPSGADAAIGLAVKIAGSEEAFVKLMNDKVKELGLENTNFTNVSGLYDQNNYSTAYDMAIILDCAMENELCRKVLSTYQYTTQKTPQNPEGILLQSTLFSYMYGTEPETATVLGGKTGFVNESGYCIASFGENKSQTEEYIVITMGNSSKWPAFYGQIDLYKKFAK